ncbi:MAG: hypothetical protein O7F70_07200 [Gemmatimonadetes bacterium]|nr:hypothetical protein [Gemmatimonadota bacterium]
MQALWVTCSPHLILDLAGVFVIGRRLWYLILILYLRVEAAFIRKAGSCLPGEIVVEKTTRGAYDRARRFTSANLDPKRSAAHNPRCGREVQCKKNVVHWFDTYVDSRWITSEALLLDGLDARST